MSTIEKLSHLDESGQARMVDVSDKGDTERVAIAKGEVVMQAQNPRTDPRRDDQKR